MTRLPLLLLSLLFTASPLLAAHRRAVAHPGRPIGMAAVARIFVVVLENEDASVALQQPFLASLAASGALLRNYHAVSHPSQPNYIAMVAGDAYGIDYDTPVTIDVAHLGDLLDAHGLSWKVYAEDYPGGCFLGSSFTGSTLFVVVFDEGTTNGPNIVYCSMNGAGIRSGTISDSWYDHYSLLRTFEQILRCGSLHRQDEAADVITDVWEK